MKTLSILLIRFSMAFAFLTSFQTMAQKLTPEQVVQTNLDFYNNRDIEGFMKSFSPEIKFYNFQSDSATIEGLEQCRKVYQNLFDQSPKLHSKILKRIVFDNKVIDHESITGRKGSDDILELVLIYEVKDEKIFRVTVLRK